MTDRVPEEALCYLDASKVESPAGVLADLDVLSSDGDRVGRIEGVVIEAAARRVRYFDVKARDRRHLLLPADHLAQVEQERHAIRLRDDAQLEDAADLDPTSLRRFSDDDLIAALFSPQAA